MTAVGLVGDAATELGIEAGLPDWIPPSDLLARVRLERGLIAPPEAGVLATWESYAAGSLDSIDRDRLASFCLRTQLEHGRIAPAVEQWIPIGRYERGRVATCSAHDLVPPLFATLADAWLAAGYPQRGLDLLEQRRTAALDTRGDDVTIRHADTATVRIARRLRLDDQRALLARLSRENDPSRIDLINSARRAVVVAYDERPDWITTVSGPEDWHSWWQYQIDNQPAPQALWPADSTETDLAADIELDIEEMRLLEHPAYESVLEAVEYWISRPRPSLVRSADPYRDVRCGLRRAALRVTTSTSARRRSRRGYSRRSRSMRQNCWRSGSPTPPRGCSGTRTSRTGPVRTLLGRRSRARRASPSQGNRRTSWLPAPQSRT